MEKEKILEMPEGYENNKVKCQDFKLYDSHVEVKLPNGMTKAISLGDFITTLAKTVHQETTMRMTLFPANCYIWGQTLTEIKLACYYPGKIRPVLFSRKGEPVSTGTITYNIPFPNIIISHTLKRRADAWEHSESKYLATSKSVTELANNFYWTENIAEQIWILPLGNIFPEGKLCQGNNTLPRGPFRDSLRALDWHFAVLYNSPFNDDLRVPSLQNSTRCESWYKILNEHKMFPYDLLIGGKKVNAAGQSMAQEVMADITNITANANVQTLTNT